MKTTLSWLKTHLDTEASVGEIADQLVMLGHDVEGIDDRAAAQPGVLQEVLDVFEAEHCGTC